MLHLWLFLAREFLELSLPSSPPRVRVLGYCLAESRRVWLSCERSLKTIRNTGGEDKLVLRWGPDLSSTKTKLRLCRERVAAWALLRQAADGLIL